MHDGRKVLANSILLLFPGNRKQLFARLACDVAVKYRNQNHTLENAAMSGTREYCG